MIALITPGREFASLATARGPLACLAADNGGEPVEACSEHEQLIPALISARFKILVSWLGAPATRARSASFICGEVA